MLRFGVFTAYYECTSGFNNSQSKKCGLSFAISVFALGVIKHKRVIMVLLTANQELETRAPLDLR